MRSAVTKGLVSVIMPVYNGEPFLRQSIRSILCQDYPHLELIAVDDGNRDRSWALLRSLQDSRIRLAQHERNRGIAAARNTGLRLARGAFITFCDQDDLLTPHSISARVEFLHQHPEVSSVFGRVLFVRLRCGHLLEVSLPFVTEYYQFYRRMRLIPRELFRYFPAFPGSLTSHLLRRDLVEKVGGLAVRWRFVDDWEYALRIAQVDEPRFLDIPVLWHLYHTRNASTRWANGRLRHVPSFVKEIRVMLRRLHSPQLG